MRSVLPRARPCLADACRAQRAPPRSSRRCISSPSTSPPDPSTLLSNLRLQGENPDTLRHIHLSSSTGFPSYATAADYQTAIRQLFLSHKSAVSKPTSSPPPPPSPVLLSFTPTPTYTLGRRQTTISPSQSARLRAPLHVLPSSSSPSSDKASSHAQRSPPCSSSYTPAVVETDRGGLTTYHGPGQVVLWPILDIHTPFPTHANFTVRSYARLLENTTQSILQNHLGIPTYLSEADPGVWVGTDPRTSPSAPSPSPSNNNNNIGGHVSESSPAAHLPPSGPGPERKIAAMGVHLRRHITGLGVALNIDIPVQGPEETNPWSRFVPCGLDGKAVTNIRTEADETRWTSFTAGSGSGSAGPGSGSSNERGDDASSYPYRIAQLWARELGKSIGTSGVSSEILQVG